jgi:hypothetical protein
VRPDGTYENRYGEIVRDPATARCEMREWLEDVRIRKRLAEVDDFKRQLHRCDPLNWSGWIEGEL